MRRRCPYCKSLVESNIKVCPHCGNPLSKKPNKPENDSMPFEIPSNPVSNPPEPVNPVSYRGYNLLTFIIITVGLAFLVCAYLLPMYSYVDYMVPEHFERQFSFFGHIFYLARTFPVKIAAFDPSVFTVSSTFLFGDFIPMFAIVIIPCYFIIWVVSWIKALIHLIANKFPKSLQKPAGLGRDGQFIWATWTFVLSYLCVLIPYFTGLWLLALGHGGNDTLKAILHMFVDETHFQGLTPYQYIFIALYMLIVALSIVRYYYKKSLRAKGVLRYRLDY